MLRIIGGEYRSRRLKSPQGEEVSRPMAARVKESVFNLLRGWFDDAIVLDLFAGVGTVGLEAVSRGARFVLMVEQNRAIYRTLQENIETLGCGGRAIAVQGDALAMVHLDRLPGRIDLLFLDPPYAMMRDEGMRQQVLDHIHRCREFLADHSFVVLRTPELPEEIEMDIEGFEGPEVHDYGLDMQVRLYMPAVVRPGEGEGESEGDEV